MARTEYYDDPEAPEPNSLVVAASGLVGTYTDPKHVIAYSDGEVRRQFNVCFRARLVGGTPALSDESLEVRWVAPADLGSLDMHHTQRLRLRHALEERRAPYLG